jgi:hypothetical protein
VPYSAAGCLAFTISLEYLWLRNNTLMNGTIPTELTRLTNAGVYCSFVCALFNMFPCTRLVSLILDCVLQVALSFSGSGLSGTIPAEIGNIGATLQVLDFLGLNLTGTIPTELGRLTTLSKILYSLMMWRPADECLSTCTHIVFENRKLVLARQCFQWNCSYRDWNHGDFRYELWRNMCVSSAFVCRHTLTLLASLLSTTPTLRQEWFAVSSRKLTGTLPSEIGLLSSMRFWWVYETSMTGTLPTSVGNWRDLGTCTALVRISL